MGERRQLDLFGETAAAPAETLPYSNPTTSKAASESMAPLAGGDEALIVGLIREHGGLTCDRVEAMTGLLHQTAAARIRGLVKKGLLGDSGREGITRSGRRAIIWAAVDPEGSATVDEGIDIPNATTARAMRDADEGRNLTRHDGIDDMIETGATSP